MSYILDALKKSEKERKKGQLPNLQTEPPLPVIGRKKRNPWNYVGALFLFAAFCALVYVLWPEVPAEEHKRMPPVTTEQPVAVESTEDPAAPVEPEEEMKKWRTLPIYGISALAPVPAFRLEDPPKPQQKRVNPAPTAVAGTAPLASIPSGRLREMVRSVEPEEVDPDNLAEQDERFLADQDDVPPPLPPTARFAVDPEQAGRSPVAVRPGGTRKEEKAEPAERIIDFIELPAAVRDELPEIRITLHLYSKNTEKSKVVVNGKLKRVGDSLGEDLEVVEIIPEGLILNFQGKKFRMKVFQ